jgi:hypothetical protein
VAVVPVWVVVRRAVKVAEVAKVVVLIPTQGQY